MRFYVDSGRTRRNGSEGHEDGLKVSGVHHEFQRSLVTQVQLPMRVLMRIGPDFAEPHEVRPESWTDVIKIRTSLASDATKCDVPVGLLPSSEKEPTFVIALIWLPQLLCHKSGKLSTLLFCKCLARH
jgi:hypothetical protein